MVMKIIGGTVRGRSLKSPPESLGVRPILNRIKKSLFDIMRNRLEGARFLDLYAGSGSVGIEALSRGAASATFVDKNPSCLFVVRKNLQTMKMMDRAHVVRADVTKDLGHVGGPFDLVFMGPPYHDTGWHMLALTQPTLQAISQAKLVKAGGWAICQHHAKEAVDELPEWTLFRQENYGDTRVSFFEPKMIDPAQLA